MPTGGHGQDALQQDAQDQTTLGQETIMSSASSSSSSSSDSRSSENVLEASLRSMHVAGAPFLPHTAPLTAQDQHPGLDTSPPGVSLIDTAVRQASVPRPPLPPARAGSKDAAELNVLRSGSSRKPSGPLPASAQPLSLGPSASGMLPIKLDNAKSADNVSSSVSSLATLYGEVFEAASRAMRGAGCHAGQLPPTDDDDARWRARARAVAQRERDKARQSQASRPTSGSPHAPYFTAEPSASSYHSTGVLPSNSTHAQAELAHAGSAAVWQQQQQVQGGYLSPVMSGGWTPYGSRGRSSTQLQMYEQLANMVPAEHAGELPPSERRQVTHTQSQRLAPPAKLASQQLPSTAVTPRQLSRPQSIPTPRSPALPAGLPVMAAEPGSIPDLELTLQAAGLPHIATTPPVSQLHVHPASDVMQKDAGGLQHSASAGLLPAASGTADPSRLGLPAGPDAGLKPGPDAIKPAPAASVLPADAAAAATHVSNPVFDILSDQDMSDHPDEAGAGLTADPNRWFDDRDKQSSGHYNWDAADQLDALGLFAGADEDDDDERQHDLQKAFSKETHWHKLRYWRVFMVAQAIALLLFLVGIILHSQVQTRVEGNVEVYRWMYFLAASPTLWVIVDITLHYVFQWLEWWFFRESLMYLRNVQRNTCTFLFVLILMPWYKTIFEWLWCEDGRCEADTYASVVDALWRVLLCAMLFTLANVIKCVVAKMLSTHFYRSAHYAKLQSALEKEVYLQMLSRPKRKVASQKRASPPGGTTTEQSPHAGAGPGSGLPGGGAGGAELHPGKAPTPTPGLTRTSHSLGRMSYANGPGSGPGNGLAPLYHSLTEQQHQAPHTGSIVGHGSHGKLSTCSVPLLQPPVDPQVVAEKKLNQMSVAMMGVSLSHYQPPQAVNVVPWPQYHLVAGLPSHLAGLPHGDGTDQGLDPGVVHPDMIRVDAGGAAGVPRVGSGASLHPGGRPSFQGSRGHRRSATQGEPLPAIQSGLGYVQGAPVRSPGPAGRPATGMRGSASATNIGAVGGGGHGGVGVWAGDPRLQQRHSASSSRGPGSSGAGPGLGGAGRGRDSSRDDGGGMHHQGQAQPPPSPPTPPPPPPPPLPADDASAPATQPGGTAAGGDGGDGRGQAQHTITVGASSLDAPPPNSTSHPTVADTPQEPAQGPGNSGSAISLEAQPSGLKRLLLKKGKRPSVEGASGSAGGHRGDGSTGGRFRRSVDGGKPGTAGGAGEAVSGGGGGGPGSVVSDRARRVASASQPLGPLAQEIMQAVPLNNAGSKDVKDMSETELEKVRTAVVIKTYTAIIRNYSSQSPEDSEREQAAVRAFSRALFNNIKGDEPRSFLVVEDFLIFFDNESHAARAFAFFDGDGDGHVTKKEVREAVEGIYRERANMADSLRDTDSIVQSLEWAVGAVVHFLFLACYLLIFGVDIIQGFSTFSATLLAFTFIFGNAVKNMFEAMLFLFVEHPYDVGDNISINKEIYRVKKITLLFTEMVAIDGQRVMYPNTELISTIIINLTRSKTQTEFIKVQVDVGVPPDVVADIMDSMHELCLANSTEFDGEPFVQYREMADPLKVVLMVSWTYAFSPDNWKRLVPARNAMFGILQAKLFEHGLKCTIQEVERKTIKQLPGFYSRTYIGAPR